MFVAIGSGSKALCPIYCCSVVTCILSQCSSTCNTELLLFRNGLSTDNKKISFAEMMTDDELISREERCFRLWINSLGISSYVNNLFEDVRNG